MSPLTYALSKDVYYISNYKILCKTKIKIQCDQNIVTNCYVLQN
jgi:hypothetical protein